MAFSRWIHTVNLTPEQAQAKKEKDEYRPPPAEGANVALQNDVFGQLFAGRRKWIDPETTFFVHILAVHPSYQRQGLGSLMLVPCLEAADKVGAKTYIEASLAGLPLYLKHGWEPVGATVVDMTPHGGHGVVEHKTLMRAPNAPNKLVTGKTLTA